MPLPVKPRVLPPPAPALAMAVPVTGRQQPDVGPARRTNVAARPDLAPPWAVAGNAAAAKAFAGTRPGSLPEVSGPTLLAGQNSVGNAAVASRAGQRAAATRPQPGGARTKPPRVADPKIEGEKTAERPDRSRSKADTGGRRSPAADPEFRALKRDVAAKKRMVGSSHPPAPAEATAARAAAVAPKDDQEARGKAAHAEEMAEAEPKEFDKAAFVKAVQDAIASRAPKTLDDAEKFGDSGKAEEVKADVQGQVGEGKDASAKAIAETTAQTPQPAPDAKPVVPLAPDQPPGQPAGPSPTQATPAALPAAATDMSAGPARVEQRMADAQVTEPQLARSNEPQFEEALADKKTLDAHSATAPEQLRGAEARELKQVKGAAAAKGPQAMTSMLGTRVATGQRVGDGKTTAKTAEEKKRTQVVALLQVVFDKTKTDVEKILSDLDKKVDEQFTKGEKDARDRFTREYTLGLAEYKRERYAGARGVGRRLKDLFLPLPKEANRVYETARDNYLTAMTQVITDIADTFERELRRAKDRIAKGRKELAAAVRKLPEDLKAMGEEAAKDFAGKFDDLKDTVDDKGTELVDTLATRYTEAVQEIDEQIAEAKEKNRSLSEIANDKVGGALKAIDELRKMLMGVLRKAVTAISAIIKDPIGFLKNLVNAVGDGLRLFIKNVGKHLNQGLFAWLLGTATSAGLQIPSTFDVLGILTIIAGLLGLTWPNLRTRIARKVPDEAITATETAVPLVVAAKKRGVAGMWDDLKGQVGDLKKDLISKLISYLTPTIIIAGITWILSLLSPASAFVRACKLIIDIIRFIITQAAQIIDFVNAVLDAVIAIARGGGGGVPALVERALARSIPVLIGVLAAILGIGGVAAKVKQIFQQLARPVTRAIDKVIDKIVQLIKKLWRKLRPKPDRKKPKKPDRDGKPDEKDKKDDKKFQWWRLKKAFKTKDGEAHTLAFRGTGPAARLVVRSNENDFRKIVTSTEIRKVDKRLATAAASAEDLLAEFDRLEEKQRKEPTQKRKEELEEVFKKLAEVSEVLFALPENEEPEPGSLEGGFGTSMTVTMLTKRHGLGSRPNTPAHAEWDNSLSKRKKGEGWVYVRGHLLSEKLGGTGKDWSNLTPITQSANQKHQSRVESKIKKLVDQGKGVYYKVTAVYGRQKVAPSKYEKAWARDPDKVRLLELLEAESYLPLRLEWEYRVDWEDGSYVEGGKPVTGPPIENKIDDQPGNYKMWP
jgi:hypothetical protein